MLSTAILATETCPIFAIVRLFDAQTRNSTQFALRPDYAFSFS